MDSHKRAALHKHQAAIMQDLDVAHIMDDLFAREVLSKEAYDNILSNTGNRSECVRLLLENLLRSGDNAAFEGFVDSLAKHYHWLWEKLTQAGGGGAAAGDAPLTDFAEAALWRAGVPRLPEPFVHRSLLESALVEALLGLRARGAAVLLGGAGSGKSTLAAAALRSARAEPLLRAPLFWLRVSHAHSHADTLSTLALLYRKALSLAGWPDLSQQSSSYYSLSSPHSSLSSMSDPVLQGMGAGLDAGWQELHESLRALFQEEPLKGSLLVLDDVASESVTDALDVGCKLLIITRDSTVYPARQVQMIKVDSGFTEMESLQVMAAHLRVAPAQLPAAARSLHALCRGGPLQISVLGAELGENAQKLLSNPDHWKDYVNKLTRKGFFTLLRRARSPERAVRLCISAAEPELRDKLRVLGALAEGARVRAGVCARLWACAERDAELALRRLTHKSLVVCEYNQELDEYEYYPHDIISASMRAARTPADTRALHALILRRYGFDPARSADAKIFIPDDGYIASHLPLHIQRAGADCATLFNRLYLDLELVGRLVRLAGQAAVVATLAKHHDDIAKHETERTLCEELREWLRTHGARLARCAPARLVQQVLLTAQPGCALYCLAARVAARQPRRLHFTEMGDATESGDALSGQPSARRLDVGEPVCAVCCLRDLVLVGLHCAIIRAYDTRTWGVAWESAARAGGAAVTWLGARAGAVSRVASADGAGELRVRALLSHCIENSDGTSAEWLSCDAEREWATRGDEQGAFVHAQWARRGDLLMAAWRTAVRVYTDTGATRAVWPHAYVSAFAVAADDVTLLVASSDTLVLQHAHSGERLLALSLLLHSAPLHILPLPDDSGRALLVSAKLSEEAWWRRGAEGALLGGARRVLDEASGARAGLCALSAAGSLLFLATDDARLLALHLASRALVLDLPAGTELVHCVLSYSSVVVRH